MENENAVTMNVEATATAEAPKKGFFTRIADGYVRMRDKVNSTKAGRFAVRALKIATGVLIVKTAYDYGKSHADVPVTLHIEGTVTESSDETEEEAREEEKETENEEQ